MADIYLFGPSRNGQIIGSWDSFNAGCPVVQRGASFNRPQTLVESGFEHRRLLGEGTLARLTLPKLKRHLYAAADIPVIMPQDISDGCIMAEKIAYVSEAKALSMKRHQLQFGDIVFSRRGELSRAAAAKTEHIGWICGTGRFLLRVSQQYIDSQWLAHVYRHDRTQRQVLGGAVGSTRLSLNNAIMAELLIPWPAIDEQREIVRRLNEYDESILREEMQLQKLAKLKSGLMHDLLTGKIRVPSAGTTG
jgi:type I restriction enzyme, S subunit